MLLLHCGVTKSNIMLGSTHKCTPWWFWTKETVWREANETSALCHRHKQADRQGDSLLLYVLWWWSLNSNTSKCLHSKIRWIQDASFKFIDITKFWRVFSPAVFWSLEHCWLFEEELLYIWSRTCWTGGSAFWQAIWAERGKGRHSMGNISANVSEEERWPLASNNDISKPLEDANVIGPNLPWNEENRHPDALFSNSVILLTGPLLCRLVWKSMISYHFAVTIWQSKVSHI